MTVDKFIKGRIILLSPVINNGDHVRKMIALIEHHDNSKNVGESSIEAVTQRFKEISNNIIKAHGGSIELESEPGQGTSFKVIIPRKNPGETE